MAGTFVGTRAWASPHTNPSTPLGSLPYMQLFRRLHGRFCGHIRSKLWRHTLPRASRALLWALGAGLPRAPLLPCTCANALAGTFMRKRARRVTHNCTCNVPYNLTRIFTGKQGFQNA